jgi:hypothetical protein
MYSQRAGDMDALAESVLLSREILRLCPPHSNLDRRAALNNLSLALFRHYERTNDMNALAEAKLLCKQALALYSKGQPGRGGLLSNLSDIYCLYFHHDGNQSALEISLDLRREVLDAWPCEHPERYRAHLKIAWIQLSNSSLFTWTEALDHLMQAITDTIASPTKRLYGVIPLLELVDQQSHRDVKHYYYSQPALDVYVKAIELLPHAAHFGLDISTRLRELSGSDRLGRAAAMRAMYLGQLTTAVEAFEEGKAVFWSQSLRLRSAALDILPAADRDNLTHLFNLLEQGGARFTGNVQDRADMEQRTEGRRHLNNQANRFIEKIRLRPGFDRFLKIPQFEKLAQAAKSGFVVALIANSQCCFAVVIQANEAPQCVVLPRSLCGDGLHKLSVQVSGSGMRDSLDRGIVREQVHTRVPLAQMWHTIVEPVLRRLSLQVRCRCLGAFVLYENILPGRKWKVDSGHAYIGILQATLLCSRYTRPGHTKVTIKPALLTLSFPPTFLHSLH